MSGRGMQQWLRTRRVRDSDRYRGTVAWGGEASNTPPDDAVAEPQEPAAPLNRRDSFRCCVQPDEQPALLMHGRTQYPVCVQDRSAGGYGVTYDGRLEFDVGQLLRLHSCEGLAEVGVAFVSYDDDTTQIGLVHIDSIEVQRTRSAAMTWFLVIGITTTLLFYLVL